MGRDLTLADVATLARVSITTVHRAEKGRALNPRIQYRLEKFVEKMEVGSYAESFRFPPPASGFSKKS